MYHLWKHLKRRPFLVEDTKLFAGMGGGLFLFYIAQGVYHTFNLVSNLDNSQPELELRRDTTKNIRP
jgi:hypothetical protein